jgi:hypothetical protein
MSITNPDDQALFESFDAEKRGQRGQEAMFLGKSLLGLGKEFFNVLSDYSAKEQQLTDTVNLSKDQLSQISQAMDKKIELPSQNFGASQAVTDTGRTLAATVQSPEDAAQLLQNVQRAYERSVEQPRTEGLTEAMKTDAMRTAELLPTKFEIERAKQQAESEKKILAARKPFDIAFTAAEGVASFIQPKTTERKLEDKALRSTKRARRLSERFEKTGRGEERVASAIEKAQKRAKSLNAFKEQQARKRAQQLGMPSQTFGSELAQLTGAAQPTTPFSPKIGVKPLDVIRTPPLDEI